MLPLRDLQRTFAAAIFDAEADPASLPIREAGGLSAARRLRIYRNNVFHGFRDALRAGYPVVERLVGTAFFEFAADAYIRHCPSDSGNLQDFGGRFAAFLQDFPAVRGLPYLPDVARLEWARQWVYKAADAPPFDRAALQSVPAEGYAALRFRLHPASRLLRSDYPLLRIWETNQPGSAGDERVDLALGGVRLLVIRRDLALEMESLGPGEYRLLRALAAGQPFARACEQALALDPAVDLPAWLCRQVAQRTLVGFVS